MPHYLVLPLSVIVLALASGCRGSSSCAPPCDPLREIGVDVRGLDPAPRQERQVLLSMTVVRIPEARVTSALGADRPAHPGLPVTVSAERARALTHAWRSDPAIEITSAPKLLALPGHEASIFVGEVVRFGETVETRSGGEIVYEAAPAQTNEDGGLTFAIEEDPEGPVHIGMRIAVVASPSADGKRIAIDLHGSWRELTEDLSPGAAGRMTVSSLEQHVREHRIDTRFEVPHDGWVLLGNPAWIETRVGRLLQVILLHTVVLAPSP